METSKAERLENAVAMLNDLIELAHGAGFGESAQFLSMAKLQLQIELNGVTEREFRALCDALDGKRGASPRARTRAGQSRSRRDAQMTLMSRAWHSPGRVAAPRGGRSRAKS